MIITRAYKIRLYPTKAQKVFFNKSFGCCRVIYNEMLYELQNAYKNGTKLNKCDLFKKIKSKYKWMKDSDSQGLCNTYQDLNSAYSSMSVENPTMDDKFALQTLKSSDSMKQELLYKDRSILEGPVL